MSANNFETWINDVADMPTKDNTGQWFDLETGLPYDPNWDYARHTTRAARKPISDKAMEARQVAKFFGGKALKGTPRQKEWAEKIRAEKLRQMAPEQAEMAADPNGLLTNSKFWIENRDKNGKQIGDFVQTQKALLKKYQTAKAAGDKETVAGVAAEYNALTTAWGWE